MKFPKTKLGFIVTGVAVFGLVLVIAVASWSSTRFNRVEVCVTCHEIFVDYDEYKQTAPLSESVEDFRPTKEYDPGYFNVTVGCAECHAYPYEEYKESPHYDNERGVRAGCVGCHEPHSVRQVLAWKFFYVNSGSTGDSPFHAVSNSLRDIPEWEKLRVKLATKARKQMMEEDSAKCKVCHKTEGLWFAKKKQHQTTEKTCIQCHYNLVHKSVKWHD
ncbi:MAG: NapC/NirT family cytochrome c [Proteobacteria bacterium]|nr:NapC/NirT family cytochrome c [Pseudomonadota bacterium]